MFQSRHYEFIADQIARARRRVLKVNTMRVPGDTSPVHTLFGLQLLEEGLNETLARDNPHFDADRFSREIARRTHTID